MPKSSERSSQTGGSSKGQRKPLGWVRTCSAHTCVALSYTYTWWILQTVIICLHSLPGMFTSQSSCSKVKARDFAEASTFRRIGITGWGPDFCKAESLLHIIAGAGRPGLRNLFQFAIALESTVWSQSWMCVVRYKIVAETIIINLLLHESMLWKLLVQVQINIWFTTYSITYFQH